ncbi:MAG TPA: hypothetical protein VJA85_04365 [Candidatus Limnocylindria bacterium]|nr:hypothetical protein [Candidatus Limnocylindria bacterium]
MSIAEARALPDGTAVTVLGVALTDSDFADGGGYLADASGGIAVLVSDGAYGRGQLLRVQGVLDDRYAQRTIRAEASGIEVLGTDADPAAPIVATGAVSEAVEGRLVVVSGILSGSPTSLSSGLAFDLDDGSGAVRVLVHTPTGIATGGWVAGASLRLIGVVGQRDSSGSGTTGYRVQPRDGGDILAFDPPPTPTPEPTAEPTPEPTPSPSPSPSATASPTPSPTTSGAPLVSIAEARAAPTGARLRIRGVVTAPSGLIEDGSAVVQDPSGAILVRLGDAAGSLALGELVELDGTRSTRSGMLTLRVSVPALRLGSQSQPTPQRRASGAVGEPQEALLLVVRGAVASTPLRTSGGSVWFNLDDGSGSLRIVLLPDSGLTGGIPGRGTWIELTGVLGQETTGREPDRGYRLWPRAAADLVVVATSTGSPAPSATVGAPRGSAGSTTPATGAPSSADLAHPILVVAIPTDTPRPDPLPSPATVSQARLGDRSTDLPGLLAVLIGFAVSIGTAVWRAWTGRQASGT